MANLITKLTARIIDGQGKRKNVFKSYATQERCEKETAAMAQMCATYFDAQGRADAPDAEYVVIYVESLGRWFGCVNLNEVLRRPTSTGGYLMICGDTLVY